MKAIEYTTKEEASTKLKKIELLLTKLHKYGVNLETGKNNADPKWVSIYLDNWINDVFEVLMDEELK